MRKSKNSRSTTPKTVGILTAAATGVAAFSTIKKIPLPVVYQFMKNNLTTNAVVYECVLPKFDTKEELKKSTAWSNYLSDVYGNIENLTYPFDTAQLWMLYTDKCHEYNIDLKQTKRKSQLTRRKSTPTSCAHAHRQHIIFTNMSVMHDKPNTAWVYQPRPYSSDIIQSDSFVEIMHTHDAASAHTESDGNYWMYYAPGSGIFFKVGKTIGFTTHMQALDWFNVEDYNTNGLDNSINYALERPFGSLFTYAKKAGYDSIFITRNDGGRYNVTDKRGRRGTVNMIEIISLYGDGSTTCGGTYMQNLLFTDKAGQNQCQCHEPTDSTKDSYVNCSRLGLTDTMSAVSRARSAT
jgi:hypothetical protein